MRTPFSASLYLSLCLLFWTIFMAMPPARAVDALDLHVAHLDGDGWRLTGLRAGLVPGADHAVLDLHIDRVELADEVFMEGVRLTCADLRLHGLGGRCTRGEAHFVHPVLGEQSLSARFAYAHPGVLDLSLEGLDLGHGTVDAQLHLASGQWRLDARGEGLDAAALAVLSADAGIPWPVTVSGRVDLSLSAHGRETRPDALALDVSVSGAAFSTEDGLRAGEDVAARLALSLARQGTDYRIDAQGAWMEGGVYLHPLFVEADDALKLALRGRFSPRTRTLVADRLRFEHPGVVALDVQGAWRVDHGLAGLDATVDLEQLRLDTAYPVYAQAFLSGTALDDLDAEGLIAGRATLAAGQPREVSLGVVRAIVHDRKGRFALDGLDASLHWHFQGEAPASRVSMDGGHVYGIGLGASRFRPVIGRDGFHLPDTARLPVLDGALEIRDLRVSGLGGGETAWRFDGGLTPISMERLTAALGWPPLSGTLAGIIPDVRYDRGDLSVGGRLLVRAFDGSIVLGGLRLRNPLGVAPELSAQIQIRDLDLAELTRTFDVGRITGRLEGDVRDLVMVRWSPVQFDAVLRTPPGDRSARRISQRAVDNLTRVGGGVGGVLSGGFMRFFEEFSYRHLGLSCRLSGEVCRMDGVAPAPGGYYIVQGSGLPRIDVIGHTREVAWRDLVNRLAAVVQGGAPVVQ